MWTLKTKSTKRWTKEELVAFNKANPRDPLPIGRLLQVELTLVFTDGTDDIEVSTWISSKDEAKQAIKQNLARLNDQVELQTEIENDTLDISEPEEPTKTQAELDQEEWVADWQKLQKVQPLIDAGVLDGNEKPLTVLQDKVKANFKVAYLDLI